MANKKAAQKAIRSDAKKRQVNIARKSRIRTFIKKVENAIKAADAATASAAFKTLEPELMRGVTKDVYKLNTAARKLSRLSDQIKKLKA